MESNYGSSESNYGFGGYSGRSYGGFSSESSYSSESRDSYRPSPSLFSSESSFSSESRETYRPTSSFSSESTLEVALHLIHQKVEIFQHQLTVYLVQLKIVRNITH